LSTVRNAQRIVVLTDNGIDEQGTHESFTDFDWLAVLDTTAYNRGGPELP
jgi:hypothetical protein